MSYSRYALQDEPAFKKLSRLVSEKESHLILELDPEDESIAPNKLADFLIRLIDMTHRSVVGIKLNPAFYERKHHSSLKKVFIYLRQKYSLGLLRILDAGHGDTGSAQKHWASANVKNYHPDIVTVNPYMGPHDTIAPCLDADSKLGLFALISNFEIQNTTFNGLTLYQWMALKVREGTPDRVGLMIDSPDPDVIRSIHAAELKNGCEPGNTAWVLAPGFDRQESFVKEAEPRAVYSISSALFDPKYLNGLDEIEVAFKWQKSLNNAMKIR